VSQRKWPRVERGHKTWCSSLSILSIGGHRGAVKLREEIIPVFSPQNGSSCRDGDESVGMGLSIFKGGCSMVSYGLSRIVMESITI